MDQPDGAQPVNITKTCSVRLRRIKQKYRSQTMTSPSTCQTIQPLSEPFSDVSLYAVAQFGLTVSVSFLLPFFLLSKLLPFAFPAASKHVNNAFCIEATEVKPAEFLGQIKFRSTRNKPYQSSIVTKLRSGAVINCFHTRAQSLCSHLPKRTPPKSTAKFDSTGLNKAGVKTP